MIALSLFLAILLLNSIPLAIGEKELLIIDNDVGTDDAEAIIFALKRSDHWQLLGLTAVGGNTGVDRVVENDLKLLHHSNRTNIPVFRGLWSKIAQHLHEEENPPYHGFDGMGGISDQLTNGGLTVEPMPAVDWLTSVVDQYPSGSITLVALGPLTNLAAAVKKSPEFGRKLKRLVIMGGDAPDSLRTKPEWNFGCDPDAAKTVFERFQCPITLANFELVCLSVAFPFEEFKECLKANDSPNSKLVLAMHADPQWPVNQQKLIGLCDMNTMMIAVGNEQIVKNRRKTGIKVDDLGFCHYYNDNSERQVDLVTQLDAKIAKRLSCKGLY